MLSMFYDIFIYVKSPKAIFYRSQKMAILILNKIIKFKDRAFYSTKNKRLSIESPNKKIEKHFMLFVFSANTVIRVMEVLVGSVVLVEINWI
jgi:hypothetical protein